MPLDQAANLVAETLTSAVDSTTTTLAVDDASAYPDTANGEYNVVVWDANNYEAPADDPDAEIVRVTGRDTGANTLAVTRGVENTSAASHPTGARVPLPLTAKMIDDIEAELDAAGGAVSVSEDGTVVVSDASDLNFASNLTVVDDGDDTVTIDAVGGTDTRADVSENGTQIVADTEDIDFSAADAATVSVTDDGDGSASVEISATDTDTDTRTDVSEATTTVVADVEDINFEATGDAGVTVADDGDGSVTVTVDATDTDTRTDISEDGTQAVAETADINFADNVSVVDDGDGSVTINATDTDTLPSTEDNGTEVLASTLTFDFGSNLNVTVDDVTDTATIDADTGSSTSEASLTTSRRYGLLGGD